MTFYESIKIYLRNETAKIADPVSTAANQVLYGTVRSTCNQPSGGAIT